MIEKQGQKNLEGINKQEKQLKKIKNQNKRNNKKR